MTKEQIKKLLLEPFETLSEHDLAQIEILAEKDGEIRRALAEARAFSSAFQKAELVRDPGPGTWTSFLAGVRGRIEARRRRIPVWRRQPVLVPVVATALVVLVLATGRFAPDLLPDYATREVDDSIPGLAIPAEGAVLTEDDYANLSELGVDAASVAAALEVEAIEAVSDEIVPESEIDAPPLIDELLALSESELEDLLAELAATRFM